MKFFEKPLNLIITIVILATTISGIGYYFYSLHQKSKQSGDKLTAIPVEVDLVRQGTLTRRLTVVGNLMASNTVTIRPNISGQISKVFARGGEEVKRGDILFELDDRSFKAKLKETQATLTHAQLEFNRAKILTEKKITPAKLLDKARSDLLRAEAAFDGAQKEVDDTKIAAPYEGVVSLHKISIGALVSPQAELLTITDLDPIKVEFKIPSKDLPFISIGQSLNLSMDSFPGQTFKGEIEAIDTKIDPVSQQIEIRGTLENKKHLLKPGSFVRVALVVGSKDNALIVPADAVGLSGDIHYVWKVIENPEKPNTYISFRVPVITGIQEKDRIEIVKGLDDNTIVVTAGQNRLSDGYPVEFDPAMIGLAAGNSPTSKDEKSSSDAPKNNKTSE